MKDTTQAEAKRRLDYIRDLYDRQCTELGIDHWADWTLHGVGQQFNNFVVRRSLQT